MDRQRRPDHWYTISSPCEPNGSGELIIDTEAYKIDMFKDII